MVDQLQVLTVEGNAITRAPPATGDAVALKGIRTRIVQVQVYPVDYGSKGREVAAETIPFRRRWRGCMISVNLEAIWGMSAKPSG